LEYDTAYFGREEFIASIFSLASLFYPEEGGRTFPQNTGSYSPDYMYHTPGDDILGTHHYESLKSQYCPLLI
jgi:hypothetical protein